MKECDLQRRNGRAADRWRQMSNPTWTFALIFAPQLGVALAAEPALPERVVIVRAEDAKGGFVPGCSMKGDLERPDAYWTPSTEQVLGIERRLASRLAELNARDDLPARLTLEGYARQYTGVIYGDKSYYYMYFSPGRPHTACDGGPKYWAMLFNAEELEFSDPIFAMSRGPRSRPEKPPLPKFDEPPGSDGEPRIMVPDPNEYQNPPTIKEGEGNVPS